MKKIWVLFSLVFFIGGIYAQMPIILESDLQKLKTEAATKKTDSDRSFRTRPTRDTSADEQVTEEQPTQTDAVVTTENTNTETSKTITKNGVKTTTTNVVAQEENTTAASGSKSDYVKKYRERQQRIKNSR